MVAADELETISGKKAIYENELRNAEVVLEKTQFKFSSDELIAAFETNFSSTKKNNTSEIPDINVSALLSPEELKPFKCAFCDERFLTEKSLYQHEQKRRKFCCNIANEEKKALRCSICDVAKDIFDSKRHLKLHILNVHESYQCSICKKAFCNEDLLKEHNAVVHVGKKAHKCSKCDGIFGSRYYLKKHMSDVHEVKKAQRSKKKKSKKKKNHLKVSEKVKKSNPMNLDGKKQYNCSICDCHFSYTAQCKL